MDRFSLVAFPNFRIYLMNSQTITKSLKLDVLICPPLMRMLLGNEYKRENITNLTLEPDLVTFDTFASLIQNKSRIMCGRVFT